MIEHSLNLPTRTNMCIPYMNDRKPRTLAEIAALPPLKRPNNAWRKKPPSTLAIYRDQFYEPQQDGVCGTTYQDHGDVLAPYRRELANLDVVVDDDQGDTDADQWPEIDQDDTSTPWNE